MKWIKKFNTEEEFKTYLETEELITPCVYYVGDKAILDYRQYLSNTSVTFPITLVEGNNGENGINLFNHILNNYDIYQSISDDISFVINDTVFKAKYYTVIGEDDSIEKIVLMDDEYNYVTLISNGNCIAGAE